jgi:hypothetical protein
LTTAATPGAPESTDGLRASWISPRADDEGRGLPQNAELPPDCSSQGSLLCRAVLRLSHAVCRTGDTIYVDYLRQFSGEKAPRAAPGTTSRAADAGGAHGSTPGGSGDAGGSRKGRWSTVGGSKARSLRPSFSMSPAAMTVCTAAWPCNMTA